MNSCSPWISWFCPYAAAYS